MTLKETEEYITRRILLQYNYDESRQIAKIALLHILNLDNLHYSLGFRDEVPAGAFTKIHEFINRLEWGEPIQYITGEAHFMGYDFMVSPAVLVPRRETEELVSIIISENRSTANPVILDIGTGSGCIAITLNKLLPDSIVYGIDISSEALSIAERNAQKIHAEVEFIQADILATDTIQFDRFDIVVSNPPYVTESEKEMMHANVLEYEPHLALFVKDEDPMKFYTKIIELATVCLKENGKIYFEINEKYAFETVEILQRNNFHEIEIIRDMQGKERIVKADFRNSN
jgi:release factor glutamine methyltransferase